MRTDSVLYQHLSNKSSSMSGWSTFTAEQTQIDPEMNNPREDDQKPCEDWNGASESNSSQERKMFITSYLRTR